MLWNGLPPKGSEWLECNITRNLQKRRVAGGPSRLWLIRCIAKFGNWCSGPKPACHVLVWPRQIDTGTLDISPAQEELQDATSTTKDECDILQMLLCCHVPRRWQLFWYMFVLSMKPRCNPIIVDDQPTLGLHWGNAWEKNSAGRLVRRMNSITINLYKSRPSMTKCHSMLADNHWKGTNIVQYFHVFRIISIYLLHHVIMFMYFAWMLRSSPHAVTSVVKALAIHHLTMTMIAMMCLKTTVFFARRRRRRIWAW